MVIGSLGKYLDESSENVQLFHREYAKLGFAEMVLDLLDEQDLNKVELAERLGKTRGRISQILNGDVNLTIETMSDVLCALGQSLVWNCRPLDSIVCDSPNFTIKFSDGWDTRDWNPEIQNQREVSETSCRLAG